MTIGIVAVPASAAMRGVTLSVVVVAGLRRLRARVWLGALLMRTAARVMGCGVEINAHSPHGSFRGI